MPPSVKQFDVEVIVVDDPWAKYGSPLPEWSSPVHSGHQSQKALRWSTLSAAVFTLALHTLILSTLVLGSPARKHQQPMIDGAAASAQNAAQGEFVSQLIFINDHSIATPDTQNDSAYAVSMPVIAEPKLLTDFAIATAIPQVPKIEVTGADDGVDSAPTPDAQGDAAGRAMLFGRYMGQIKARIERAWVYPVNTSLRSFMCTAQIKQTKQGGVQEVTLQRCDSDGAWQLSLAKAIQAASPLPAPPDEHVFTEAITLSFDVEMPTQ